MRLLISVQQIKMFGLSLMPLLTKIKMENSLRKRSLNWRFIRSSQITEFLGLTILPMGLKVAT
jgi:uncharacterized membrane protein